MTKSFFNASYRLHCMALPLVAVFFVVASGGCATVARGDSQKIKFTTDPAGATLKVADKTYTTPTEIELKRKQDYDITITKEGYRTVIFQMKSTWDGASLPGAVLPGGSLMVAADRSTGADLAFYDPPTIKLDTATGEITPKLMVFYRGALLTKADYDKQIEQEKADAFRHRE